MGKEFQPSPSPEEEREAMRASAFKFFITASREAPASITAQGALIATYCQTAEITNPEDLGDSLLSDDDRIIKLTMVAERMHKYVGNGPVSMSRESVKDIIKTDFTKAQDYIGYSKEDLEYISSELHDLVKVHHRYNEIFYGTLAREVGEKGQRYTKATIGEAFTAFQKEEQEKAMFGRNEVLLKKFGEVS